MKINLMVPAAGAALLLMSSISLATQPACDTYAEAIVDVKAAIGDDCPCGGTIDGTSSTTVPWKNHGQYMKCVTHARKTEAKSSGVPLRCLKDVVPCAAHSSCGKSSVVACEQTTPGTCLADPNPGDAVADGTCENDSLKLCDTDADCSQSSCVIADSEQDCTTTLGGAVTTGNCCQ